jgi:hypothetical protein
MEKNMGWQMNIEDIILKFFIFCKQQGKYEFYAHQLERFVHQEYVGNIAVDSIRRQMRYAQEKRKIDYDYNSTTKLYTIIYKKTPFGDLN